MGRPRQRVALTYKVHLGQSWAKRTMADMDRLGDDANADLRVYARTVWRHRWLIVATVVVAVGGAVGVSLIQTPVYEGTADVIVKPSETQQILSPSNQSGPDAQVAARDVDAETAVLQSKVIQDAAKHKLGHTPDVTISSDSANSNIISVSARSTSPRAAAHDANTYADTYVAFRRKQNVDELVQAGEQIQGAVSQIDSRIPSLPAGSSALTTAQAQRAFLQQQLDQLQVSANLDRVGGAEVLGRAAVPRSPVEPQPARNAAIALAVALLLGIGLAFLREYFEDKINSREDLERAAANIPVLGLIPRVPGWGNRGAPYNVSLDAPRSPATETFRTLRTSIQFLGVNRKLATIQVTSARIGEGKTTVCANLAVAFARAGRTVTILGCDLRRPRIHEFVGLSNDVGFTSLLLGEASLVDALQPVPGEPNLTLLSAGPPPPNPSELLSSARAREIITSIEKTADLVLVDSPPLLPVSDGLVISGIVDGTLLVVSMKLSSRRELDRSLQILAQVDAPVIGTILNNAELGETYGGYGRGYLEPATSSNGDRVPRSASQTTRRRAGPPKQRR